MLRQPYPISERSPLGILITGLLGGALVAFVLIVFEPFGTARTDFPYKTVFLAGYGLIAAMVYWLMSIVPATVSLPERWTVGKQLIAMVIAILLGITASYFYLMLLGGSPNWTSYRLFVVNAMSVAIFPVLLFTLADYALKYRKYARGAIDFNEQAAAVARAPLSKANPVPSVTLSSPDFLVVDDQNRPLVTLPANRIWCLRSDRNYVDIFHFDADGQPAKTTVRNTLTNLSEGLPANFLRCQRSYLVNINGVGKVTGNAQGYRLHHPGFPDVPVLVSRGKSAEILGFIR